MYKKYLRQNGFLTKHGRSMENNLTQSDTTDKMGLGNTAQELNGNVEESEKADIIQELGNGVNNDCKRKLVLHFDIRNTVLVADSVTNVSVEQALNSFLTGVVWGREDADGQWQWHSDKLSLTPPTDDTVTYYKYLEKQFVKNTNDRTMLRLATGDFAESEFGKIFKPHFHNHLELLKWKYDFSLDTHNCLTMSGKDGQQYNYIVPAVYKLIHHLQEKNRDFAIVFRTYGLDAPNVIASLEHGLNGNHPGYPNRVELKIDQNIGTVKRSKSAPIVFTEYTEPSQKEQLCSYVGDREIYDMLSKRKGISGIRDDINFWLENSYNHFTAKPHIIDPFDQSVHHIFFDDNIRTFEDDSIVDVRMFETRDAKEARSLSKTEAGQFDHLCMVQADLMQCIEDENYYVDRVNECENRYSTFLKRWKKFSRCISLQHSIGPL